MRKWVLLVVCLAASLPTSGKTVPGNSKALPKDPIAILAAAAPYYDFNDPSLKPWYMRVSYQLYDEAGKPAETGAFDYWWASPTTNRATWSRSGSAYTVWHTADGSESDERVGHRLEFFERQLRSAFLSPLPSAKEVESSKNTLQRQVQSLNQEKLPCVMVVPQMEPQETDLAVPDIPIGLFPTYCFEPDLPVLRIVYSWGSVMEVFNRIAKVQGRYLPREIQFYEGGHTILTANVQVVTGLNPSDPALKPDPDAKAMGKPSRVTLEEKVIDPYLIKKVQPIYPADAMRAHAAGTVELRVVVATDGTVHEMQVLKAPWPSLVASAMWAVSHWEFKPYLLNGKPVEAEVTIKVIFKQAL